MPTRRNQPPIAKPPVPAPRGTKMIELSVHLYTEEISPNPGTIIPKHAWAHGVVRIKRNASHGIIPIEDRHFHSLMEIPAAIEQVLIDNEITIRKSTKMRKYIA